LIYICPAIEDELEQAIYKAGGIIESNFGNLSKISWARSSRTDKGVHSLSTVISMKMEVPTAAWVNDFDGITLAESINMHLPPFIRIFGIVPVTRYYNVDEPAVILPICVPVAVVQTAPQLFVYFRV
jgi:tRNA pseudouridine38-40 synthase